jgi:hypothetical protein
MRPLPPSQIVVTIVVLIVAVWFGASTFSRRWFYAAWVKLVFRAFAFAALVSCSLRFTLAHYTFPWATFWALYTWQMICLGIALGMLVLFFLSGEPLRGYRRWREFRQEQRTPATTSKA